MVLDRVTGLSANYAAPNADVFSRVDPASSPDGLLQLAGVKFNCEDRVHPRDVGVLSASVLAAVADSRMLFQYGSGAGFELLAFLRRNRFGRLMVAASP